MNADITLVNLNMLYVRYADGRTEREKHLPLGPLYLTTALERAGFTVDFRDYQTFGGKGVRPPDGKGSDPFSDPFRPETIAAFLEGSAPVLGASCMANLLPFTLLALEDFKRSHPETTVVLGGVGAKSVERQVLDRCPWIDVIAIGEGEISGPMLVRALTARAATPAPSPFQGEGGGEGLAPGRTTSPSPSPFPLPERERVTMHLEDVPGIAFMRDGEYVETPRPARIKDLDTIPPPAYHHIRLKDYEGYGMVTSRGCPYPCTFCSVAPIWDHESYFRSGDDVIAEMRRLHEEHGVNLFLFQDEFFVSGKARVMDFCEKLGRSGLAVKWKAFGRVNLTDEETMRAMAATGCCEIRYGIESGSDAILARTRKGFTAAEAVEVVAKAVTVFDRTDCFYIWGYPFETMDDFHQSVFQMVSFRAMGARILPSLLCLLPQTDIYREVKDSGRLEFCPELFPEYMITGHEVLRGARCRTPPEHARIFDFIRANPDIFPGFFHYDLEGNVLPKLAVLQEFGFYGPDREDVTDTDSCGAHSPKIRMARPQELATRAAHD